MQRNQSGVDVNRWVLVFVASSAIIIVGIWPLFAALLAGSLKLGLADQGWIISSESLGMVAGTAMGAFLSRFEKVRIILLLTAIITIVFNTITVYVDSFSGVLICRFATGSGAGVCYALAVTLLGSMKSPDRSYGIALALQTLFFCSYAVLFPVITERLGGSFAINSVGFWFAGIFFAAILLSAKISKASNLTSAGSELSSRKSKAAALLGLVGMAFLQLSVYAVWGFIGNIGAEQGITEADIGIAFGIGLVGGLPGAALAGVIGTKWGRGPLIFAGAGLVLLSVVMLKVGPASTVELTAAVFLMNFGWMLALSYYMALVASNDTDGKITSLMGFVQIGGATLAPTLIAMFSTGNDLSLIFSISWASAALAALMPITLIKRGAEVQSV